MSIGTVVKELREELHLSRSRLANISTIPVSRLASIERGDSFPDEGTVAALASALQISANALYRRARDTYQQRVQLRGFLEHLGIPQENWDEFFSLQPEIRAAFIQALQLRLPSRDGERERIGALHQVEDAIERDGVEASVHLILSTIEKHGLAPIEYLRASVELEEMPGSRFVFTDRLPLSTVTVPVDQLYLFRAYFGIDPPNPMLLKWWAEARRSAVDVTMQDHLSRTIISIQSVERYIRKGERAPNILLSPDIVQSHLVAIVKLLRRHDRFQLGFAEERIPLNYRVKGDHRVLVIAPGYDVGQQAQHAGMALRFSRPGVVKRFREHFDRAWNSLRADHKDQKSVADWLEQQIPEVGRR